MYSTEIDTGCLRGKETKVVARENKTITKCYFF